MGTHGITSSHRATGPGSAPCAHQRAPGGFGLFCTYVEPDLVALHGRGAPKSVSSAEQPKLLRSGTHSEQELIGPRIVPDLDPA